MPTLRESFGGSLTALLATLEAETLLDKALPLPPDQQDDFIIDYSDEIDEDYDPDPSQPSSTDSLTLDVPPYSSPSAGPTALKRQTVMTKRVHALRELLSSERAYASDLALIRDIHIPLALGRPAPFNTNGTPGPSPPSPSSRSISSPQIVSTTSDSSTISSQLGPPMTRDDVRIIFSNIEDLAMFSAHFVERLEEALGDTLDGGNGEDSVGALFLEIIPALELPYKTYITRHLTALAHLKALPSSPALSAYLFHTRTLTSSLTQSWGLPSLLIKPVQRLMKYSLLLGAIINITPDSHGDCTALIKAREKMGDVTRSVNMNHRRWEVVRGVLQGSAPTPSANKLPKSKKVNVGVSDAEAVEVARLEGELQRYVAFLDKLAEGVKEWRLSFRKVMVALWQWGITFGAVLGVTPSPSVMNKSRPVHSSGAEEHSEAYDAFILLLCSLPGLCADLEQEVQKSVIPLLSNLKAMMQPPMKLLNAMHSLEPLHLAHLHSPFSQSKSRRPSPALPTASQSYLALRSSLSVELPVLLRAMNKATGLVVRMIAEQQSAFFASVRERWAELWDALTVEGEICGGAEETLRVWWERWGEVDTQLSMMKVIRKDRYEGLPVPRLKPGFSQGNVGDDPHLTKSNPAVWLLRTTLLRSLRRGHSQRRSSLKDMVGDAFLPTHRRQSSSSVGFPGASSSLAPSYHSTDVPPSPYSPSHHQSHASNGEASPASHQIPPLPTLATTCALYTTRAIHPCIPPVGVSYRGLPFLRLICDHTYDVLREYQHPSMHVDLPLYVDDGEDCLLLIRARSKGDDGYEAGDVGWALASFLLPVD